ncbi:hypothetical protein [Frankia sp. Cj3]|uniref:hypothetical protein n=1 Tax=Frankia sp. Cj3 TaxID=2880976 RepID=UPI001EF48929|nr:hypothetical protein [Frankia sp. Cj3]
MADASAGRSIKKSKTVEPASIFTAQANIGITINISRMAHTISPNRQTVGVGVRVAVPQADTSAGQAPKRHYLPPARIQRDQRLGSSDVVWDVYEPAPAPNTATADSDAATENAKTGWSKLKGEVLSGTGAPAVPGVASGGGGIRGVLNTLDAGGQGQAAFGGSWTKVKKELADLITLDQVHQHLQAMMSGQPLSFDLNSVLSGRVEITARVVEMTHVRSTPQTEFNVGSEVHNNTNVRSVRTNAATLAGQGVVTKNAPDDGTITGTGQLARDNVTIHGESSKTGMTNKTKTFGEVFDGKAELIFRMTNESIPGQLKTAVGTSTLGFRTVLEGAELVAVKTPTPWIASSANTSVPVNTTVPATAAPSSKPDSVMLPPRRVFGPGLLDTDVVRDMYGIENVRTALDTAGERFFKKAAWWQLRDTVLDGFSRDELIGRLSSMTRGQTFSGPDLVQRLLPPGSMVTATATVHSMQFRRDLATELSPQGEKTTFSSQRRLDWSTKQIVGSGGRENEASETVGVTQTAGGGYQHLGRQGPRQTANGKVVSNAKFPLKVAVFDSEVDLHFTFSTKRGEKQLVTVRVPVEISIPSGQVTTVTGPYTGPAKITAGDYQGILDGNTVIPPTGWFTKNPGDEKAAAMVPPQRALDGRLASSDIVLGFGPDDSALLDGIQDDLEPALGTAGWWTAKKELSTRLDPAILKSNLAALTGGKTIAVKVSGNGWSGKIRVRAEIGNDLVYQETLGKVEFENGAESETGIGFSSESQHRGIVTTPLKIKAPHVSATVTPVFNSDWSRSNVTQAAGRSITKGKTVEDGALFKGSVHFHVDFDLTRLGQRFPIRNRTFDVTTAVIFPERDTQILQADTTVAPRIPDKLFAPPPRVTQTLRLTSSDIVQDVYSTRPPDPVNLHQLPAPGRPPGGMTDVLAWVDAKGRGIFGSQWPAVVKKITTEVSMTRLHQDFKTMMGQQPIVVTVPRGRVMITASVRSMTHVNNTTQTEFNSGSERSVTNAASDTGSESVVAANTSRSGGATVQVTGSIDPTGASPVTARVGVALTGLIGRDDLGVQRTASKSAMTTKTKVPGAAFDGIANLHFRMEYNPYVGPKRTGIDVAQVGFRGLTEQVEARSSAQTTFTDASTETPTNTPTNRKIGPTGFDAPAPDDTLIPPARVFSAGPDGGLRDSDVVRGLPDTGGLHQLVEVTGKKFFGPKTWKKIGPIVRATTSNPRLTAHLPGMTRGETLSSPPLRNTIGASHASVTATAEIVELRYIRQDKGAELNPVNETSTQASMTSRNFWIAGLQGQAGPEIDLGEKSSITVSAALGFQYRNRHASAKITTGRVVDNGKFSTPTAIYEGFTKITFTFQSGDTTSTVFGVVPVELGIPVAETTPLGSGHSGPAIFNPPTVMSSPQSSQISLVGSSKPLPPLPVDASVISERQQGKLPARYSSVLMSSPQSSQISLVGPGKPLPSLPAGASVLSGKQQGKLAARYLSGLTSSPQSSQASLVGPGKPLPSLPGDASVISERQQGKLPAQSAQETSDLISESNRPESFINPLDWNPLDWNPSAASEPTVLIKNSNGDIELTLPDGRPARVVDVPRDGDCFFAAKQLSESFQHFGLPPNSPTNSEGTSIGSAGIKKQRFKAGTKFYTDTAGQDFYTNRDPVPLLLQDLSDADLLALLPKFTPNVDGVISERIRQGKIRDEMLNREEDNQAREDLREQLSELNPGQFADFADNTLPGFTPTVTGVDIQTRQKTYPQERANLETAARREELNKRLRRDPVRVLKDIRTRYRQANNPGMTEAVTLSLNYYSQHGALPDSINLFAHAVMNTILWNTPFGDEVPQITAGALGQNIIVLENGVPPNPLSIAQGEALYVLRDGRHYLALQPDSPLPTIQSANIVNTAINNIATNNIATNADSGVAPRQVPAGLVVPPPPGNVHTAAHDRAAATVPPIPGHTMIFGHSDPVTGNIRWGSEVLDPAQFADRIRRFPGWNDHQPIILVICGGGKTAGPGSFASRLRDVLGVDVIASSRDVWHLPDGRIVWANTAFTSTGLPAPILVPDTASDSVGWSRYTADGQRVDLIGNELNTALTNAGVIGITSTAPMLDPPSAALRWGAGTAVSELVQQLPTVPTPVYASLPPMSEDAVVHWVQAASEHPLTVSSTLPQTGDGMTVVQFPPGTGRDASALLNATPATVTVAVVDPAAEVELVVSDWPEPGSTFVTLRDGRADPSDPSTVAGASQNGRSTGDTKPVDTSRGADNARSRWQWSGDGMHTFSEMLRWMGAARAAELVREVERFAADASGRALLTPNDLLALVVRGHNGIHRTTAYAKKPPESRVRTYHGWMYAANLFAPEMAAAIPPGTRIGLPGFVRASGDPAVIVGAAVGLAIFGTALDISEANGQPPGSTLLIMPGHSYAVTEVSRDLLNAVRVTLVE